MLLTNLKAATMKDGYGLIDCQMHTAHLESLGARPVPRREFIRQLGELIHLQRPTGSWASAGFENSPCRS